MSDLDLDELDKQVSKLMDQANKPKAKKPAPANNAPKEEPAVTPQEPPVPAPEPKLETKDEKPADTDAGSPIEVRRQPVAQIIPKRKGIAMDIVQPAKQATPEPPSVRTSRTAPTLQPTGTVTPEPPHPRETTITPEPKKEELSDETLASLNLQKDSPAPAQSSTAQHSDFPDPLDVHGFTDGEEKSAGDAPTSTPPTMQHTTVVQPPADALKEEPKQVTPPEASATPFVNAKVEKRPLGAFAEAKTDEAATEPAPEPADTPKDATAKDDKTDPTTVVPPPPKELNPELVAVESSEPEFTPGTVEAKKPSVNDLRQMSIPQQYKTTDAEPSREDRPIFDTKTYHPPIQPVAKAHKSGGSRAGMLLTVILIILLVVASVGAYYVATGGVDLNKLF